MKHIIRGTAVLTGFFIMHLHAAGQVQFTRYDDIPGIYRSYKPAYSDDLPEWAKLLYRDTVNYHDVTRAYALYAALHHPGENSPVTRYYKMWSRAVESCVLPDGTIRMPDLLRYHENLRARQLGARQHGSDPTAAGSDWSFLGPRETYWLNESGSSSAPSSCPWQANVYAFDVAVTDNSVIYCGTETGFMNKTTDKGLTWEPVGLNYPFGGGITAVAVHPSDPGVVYAAAGSQVHKSINGGISWAPVLPAGNQFAADRLKIDPLNPQKIFAASSGGLFISTDGGSAWTRKWTAPVYDVEIMPGDGSRVFALTRSGGNFSVIMSVDGGVTFQTQPAFPGTYAESGGGLLAMTPSNPGIMFAILLCSGNTPYLLKGTLSGSAWTWSLRATGATSAFPMNNGQGYFDLAMEISPVNENILLVGTTTLYKSVNGGNTFSAVGGYSGSFSIHPDIQDIRMLPNGDTWVSTDGGMNLTTDNFSNASNYHPRVNGLIGSDFWGFDQGWNEDIVVGGRYHNGNTALAGFYQPKALRMGGAESPTGWVLQGKSRHAAFNDLGNGWILPQTAEGMPEGRFIFSKYPNMEEYGGRRSNLLHHPNYYGTLYLGEGTGFWRSTDMGVTWDLLHSFSAQVRYIQMSYSDPHVIYADIPGSGLCKSEDGGMTWVVKPSLTAPPYGTANWKGKLFFAISPYDGNLIYACLQNGTWSADLGKVFRSTDGGDTWQDWTGSLSEYMKCMVVQPSSTGEDLVYLFTNGTNGNAAKVFYRKTGLADWVLFNNNFPAGMHVNMALPFFRDGRLRLGGNAGVWESPMADTGYMPVINPWVEKALYDCALDTILFDDHSILAHSGVTWQWDITPAPQWIEDPSVRNPRVVLGSPGVYDVSLTITKNGQTFTKSISNMVTAEECPSVYNCENPAMIPKEDWSLVYADSQEINDPGLATMSFDNNPATIWHTRWTTGNDPYPHEIRVGLGGRYKVSRFTYLTRQDGENGRIREYELYISDDTASWGTPVMTGAFVNTPAPQTIEINPPVTGRFFRLVALSEVNGNPWASAAEFSIVGCVDWPAWTGAAKFRDNLAAFPVPTSGVVEVSIPQADSFRYQVLSSTGHVIDQGIIEKPGDTWHFNLGGVKSGIYLIRLVKDNGVVYSVKVQRK